MVDKFNIDEWLNCGRQIAEAPQYYNRLSDMNDDNQPDFDNVYFFADDEKPDSIYIRTAIARLKRRASKGVSDRQLKDLLTRFNATSEILFANSKSTGETMKYLLDNGLKPDYDKTYDIRAGGAYSSDDSMIRPSGWKRFNNWVGEIGEYLNTWVHASPEDVEGFLLFLVMIIGAIIVVVTLITDGFWSAVIAAVVSFIFFGLASVVTKFVAYLCYPIMFVIRWLFYNAWTLFGFIVVYTAYLLITIF